MHLELWADAEPASDGRPLDVVRLRSLTDSEAEDLRAAIVEARRLARAGATSGVIFELDRGFTSAQRVGARLVVGVGVVVAIAALVVAFLVPDQTASALVVALVATAVVSGTALLGVRRDVGVEVSARGVLRRTGWGGIADHDLARAGRVTIT